MATFQSHSIQSYLVGEYSAWDKVQMYRLRFSLGGNARMGVR